MTLVKWEGGARSKLLGLELIWFEFRTDLDK